MKPRLFLKTFSHTQLIVFALFFAAAGGVLLYKSFALNPNLPGDVNNDNAVNVTDLSILLSNYNTNYPPADFNSDSTVNILDLSILLSNYGRTYAGTPQPPTNQRQTGSTTTSITMSWDPPSSGPLPSGYDVYLNSNKVASVNASTSSYTYSNLTCNTSYDVGLVTKDAAGSGSDLNLARGPMSTTACATQPPPPPSGGGNIIELSGTVSASSLTSQINAAPSGAVTVRPASGQSSFTVSGDVTITRQNVTIQHAVLRVVYVGSSGSGIIIENSQLMDFESDGANNWILRNNTLDGQCVIGRQYMYRSKNWQIINNQIKNYHVCADESEHSESFYIGAGVDGGLIQGNTFTDNGTTGQLFFTWWDQGGSGSADPKNICVQNNSFIRTHNQYHHIDMRAELNSAINNIDISPNNTWDSSGAALSADSSWVRPC
jgi:hypothetical protein